MAAIAASFNPGLAQGEGTKVRSPAKVDVVLIPHGSQSNRSQSIKRRYAGRIAAVVGAGVVIEAVLIRLGQTYGSTPEERALRLARILQ
jgi:hypothetical protein